MNDRNKTARLLQLDRMIDEIAVRRAGSPLAPAPAGAPPATDEALVMELAGLSVTDWPPDEAGDRIARGVAGGIGQPQPDAPVGRYSSGRRLSRARRWLAVGLAAAAAVLLAVAVRFGPWPSGTSRVDATIQVTISRHWTMRHGAVPPGHQSAHAAGGLGLLPVPAGRAGAAGPRPPVRNRFGLLRLGPRPAR